jgi:hypothetical protein
METKDDWLILNVYVNEPDKIEMVLQNVENLGSDFKKQKLLTGFYFNRYIKPTLNKVYIKLGFYQIKEDAKKKLYNELDKMETKDIKENTPDLNVVDGVTRDFIKTVAYELRKLIKEKLNEKPTQQQMFYLIHLLMNQLGYSYQEELLLYQNLFANIHYELHKEQ